MESFFYQIGSTTTNIPWKRPSYHRVKSFLQDDSVSKISKKYKIELCGGFLYDKLTWDLDILLIHEIDQIIDFNQIENDFNTLYDTALNKYDLLIDVAMSSQKYPFPSKSQLIDYNKDKPLKNWTYNRSDDLGNIIIKLGYIKKINQRGVGFEYAMSPDKKSKYGKVTKLTDNYLYKTDRRGISLPYKYIDMIMKLDKDDNISPSINYTNFLSMTGEEYYSSLIKMNETN